MAYEREAVPDSTSIPTQTTQTMREERVLEPYKVRGPSPTRPIGQPSANEGRVEAIPEDTVKLSPQVAALARREQKFRAQQQQLAQDRAKLESERQEIAQLRAMKEKLAAKDYSGLEGLVDYNDFSQYQINKLNGTDPTQEELRKLNGKIEELQKFSEDNVNKQFDAAVEERRMAAKDLVAKTPDFPRIKKAGAEEAVVQHILDTWEHDSLELSVADAAKEVEEVLTERARQWKALLEDEEEVIPEEAKKPLPPLKQGLKTLTNQVTSGDVKRQLKPLHLMNDADRYAEARRRAEEKLNQQQTRR